MPDAGRDTGQPPRRRLLTDDVYDRLRDDIVRGYLAPGARIHDLELAQSLGLSRATVRTALLRLGQLGLVETVPNLYTRVTAIDLRRYFETQDTARALYAFAARFATPVMTDDLVERMSTWARSIGDRDAVDPESVFTNTTDDGFFQVFVEALDSRPLTKTLERLRPTLQRVLGQFAHLMPAREIDAAFLTVVDAVRRRDSDGAGRSMSAFYDGPLATFHERLARERV